MSTTVNIYSANQSDVVTDTSGFAAYVGTAGSMTRDTAQAWHGLSSLKVITDGTGAFQYVNAQIVATRYVPSQQYTASFYILAPAAGGTLRYFVDSDSGAVSSVSTLTLSTSWTRYTVTFTAPAASAGKNWMGLRLDTGSPGQALSFWWDGLQMEEGAAATSWVVGTAGVYTPAPVQQPQYAIRLRDASLNPVGVLSAYTGGDILLKMNDVGTWALTVRADDPLLPYFTRGRGVIITRDLGDGAGARFVCSGPIWSLDRLGKENEFTLSGSTDELWLHARNALPQGGRPYMAQVLLDGPLRYYRLDDASGPTAADSSLQKQNGTYSASGVTYGVAGAVAGDPDTAVTLNGTAYVTVPATGLPTGNPALTLEAWIYLTANPGGNAVVASYGTSGVAHERFALFVNSSGQVLGDTWGGATGASAALSLNAWHHVVVTWDGTTLRCYVDGAQTGTSTPGAMAIPASGNGAAAGSDIGGGSPFPGRMDEAAFYGTALSAAQVAAHYAAGHATHGAYDTRSGVASTVLLGYVNANLIAPVNSDRDMSAMTAAADPGVGTIVTGNARWDNLLALLQQLASSGGDIGFSVQQTANGVLTFAVYQPTDRSSSVKFSLDLQDLFDFKYALAGPQANSVDVLGGGQNAARVVSVSQDAASIGAWGLVEGMLDARDTSDVPTMAQRGAAEIAAKSEQTNLAITPRDTATLMFQRDYNLGDTVAVIIDGNTITQKVRSVHIQLANPGDQEVITPGIGNPSQGDVAHWFDPEVVARAAAMQRIQAALTKLSGSQ